MKIVISTHKGVVYNDEIDYFVIKNDEGEFAVLNNHISVISVISDGYVKIVKENTPSYHVIVNGLLEFRNNEANILAQEAISGITYEIAREKLAMARKKRIEENKKTHIDYTTQENELKKSVKASRAGRM